MIGVSPEKISQPNLEHGDSLTDQNSSNSDSNQEQNNSLNSCERSIKRKPVHPKEYTKETIAALINCITVEKMSIRMASETVNMMRWKAFEIYKAYRADPEHKIPEPKPRYNELEKLEEKHIRFIKDFCQKNKGRHERVLQAAFHAHFPNTRVVQRLLLPHMNKKKRTKKTAKRNFVKKIDAEHTEFITGLYVKEPGISFAQVHRLLLKQFPGLTISKPGLQVHIHRHLKDVLTGSTTRPAHHTSKKLDARHIDFIRNLYDERPKMPFLDVYQELTQAYPTLSITPVGLRIYLRTNHATLYKSNNTLDHKLKSEHTRFLVDLYMKKPDTTLEQARLSLMDAFPGLSISNSSVHCHLKLRCRILLKKE